MQRTEKINVQRHTNKNTFSITEILGLAWHEVKGTKRIFFTVTALLTVVICSSIFIEQKVAILDLSHWSKLTILPLTRILSVSLNILLGAALVYLGIMRTSNRSIKLEMIKYVFDIVLFRRIVTLYLLQFIILFPIAIILYGSVRFRTYFPSLALNPFYEITRSIIAIVTFILFVHLSLRLYLTKAIVVAKHTPPWEAIRMSFMATKSHVWKLLGIFIINFFIIIFSSMLLGIGLLWGIPFCFINYALVYKKLELKS